MQCFDSFVISILIINRAATKLLRIDELKSEYQVKLNLVNFFNFYLNEKPYKGTSVLTLHVLRHDPVVEQPVVLHRALHRLHQQVVGGGPGSVRLALGLSAVCQAGQEEEEVVDVPQELLTLAGELEGRFVFEDAGGETQEAGQPVVLDRPVLLVQDLTAGGDKNTEVMMGWR